MGFQAFHAPSLAIHAGGGQAIADEGIVYTSGAHVYQHHLKTDRIDTVPQQKAAG